MGGAIRFSHRERRAHGAATLFRSFLGLSSETLRGLCGKIFAVVACVFALSLPILAASEADWFYQAAALEARFEKISSAQIPTNQKMDEYYKLLDDVQKFADVAQSQPVGAAQMSEREVRGRKAFSLLATGWIQQMLANTDAANKVNAEYKKLLETMPDDEKAIATCFFERDYQKSPVSMPRVCNVEARGYAVRVTAVDWPLRDLLQRMAEATGVRLSLPDEVSGITDLLTTRWQNVDVVISSMAPNRGLFMGDRLGHDAVVPLRVKVDDPLYMASIGERAAQVASQDVAEKPREGIRDGYVIVRGRYISAPYVVEVRESADSAVICINGVPLDGGHTLVQAPVPQAPPLPQARTDDDVLIATDKLFADLLRQQHTPAEAGRILEEQLKRSPLVNKVFVSPEGLFAQVDFKDGIRMGVDLTSIVHEVARERDPNRKPEPSFTERVMTKLLEQKKKVEDTLKGNGLVVAPRELVMRTYSSERAQKMLAALCVQMEEISHIRETLSDCLYGRDGSRHAYRTGWDLMINLRNRELAADLGNNGAE